MAGLATRMTRSWTQAFRCDRAVIVFLPISMPLCPRFYTAGFLAGGSNYLEMLQHVEAWIFTPGTVRVVYAYEEKHPLGSDPGCCCWKPRPGVAVVDLARMFPRGTTNEIGRRCAVQLFVTTPIGRGWRWVCRSVVMQLYVTESESHRFFYVYHYIN